MRVGTKGVNPSIDAQIKLMAKHANTAIHHIDISLGIVIVIISIYC